MMIDLPRVEYDSNNKEKTSNSYEIDPNDEAHRLQEEANKSRHEKFEQVKLSDIK